ncbi:perilipin 6 [Aplochiton taeniatus]
MSDHQNNEHVTVECPRCQGNVAVRVARLPLFSSALLSVTSAYTEVKGRYPVLGLVGDAAEIGVRLAAQAALQRASPLLQTLEPQFEAANDYACEGLDQLEKNFPVLQQSTEEVLGHLKDAFYVTLDDVQLRVNDELDGVAERWRRLTEAVWTAAQVLQDSEVGRVAASGMDEVLTRLEEASALYMPLPPSLHTEWERRIQQYEDEDDEEEPGMWTRVRSLLLCLSLQLYQRLTQLRERLEQAAAALGNASELMGLGVLLEVVGSLMQRLQLFYVAQLYNLEVLRKKAMTQVRSLASVLAQMDPVRQILKLPVETQGVIRDLQELGKMLLQLVVNSTPLYNMLQQPSPQEVEDFLKQEQFSEDNSQRRDSSNSLFLRAMDGRPRRRRSLYARSSNPPGLSPGTAPSLSPANGGKLDTLALPSDEGVRRRSSTTELLLAPIMQLVSQSQRAFDYLSPASTDAQHLDEPVIAED